MIVYIQWNVVSGYRYVNTQILIIVHVTVGGYITELEESTADLQKVYDVVKSTNSMAKGQGYIN